MTTINLSRHPAWIGVDRGRRTRWRWILASLLVHLCLLAWLARVPVPARVGHSGLIVTFDRARPPDARLPVAPPAPTLPAAPPDVPARAPARSPATTVSPAAPSEPELRADPDAAGILGRMSRYRLDGRSQIAAPRVGSDPPRQLGHPPPGNLLNDLEPWIPPLPFSEAPIGLDFYPFGLRGTLARTWERMTPEFGFTTSFGLEVKCVYVLVVVTCGWREK